MCAILTVIVISLVHIPKISLHSPNLHFNRIMKGVELFSYLAQRNREKTMEKQY